MEMCMLSVNVWNACAGPVLIWRENYAFTLYLFMFRHHEQDSGEKQRGLLLCWCAYKNVQSAVVAQYVIDNACSCAFEDYCFFSSNGSNYQPSGCRKIIQTLKRELLIASNYAEWLLDYHYWSLLRLLPINPFSQPSSPALSDAVDSLGTYLWR